MDLIQFPVPAEAAVKVVLRFSPAPEDRLQQEISEPPICHGVDYRIECDIQSQHFYLYHVEPRWDCIRCRGENNSYYKR